jgi:hypothetical protein
MRFRYLNFSTLEQDPPWEGAPIAVWFTLEINIPIVIACIPTIKPLVAKLFPRLLESPPGSDVNRSLNPPTISASPRRLNNCELDDLGSCGGHER